MFRSAHRFAAILAVAICCDTPEPASAQTALIAQNQPAKENINPRRPDADPDCLSWTNGCVNCLRSKPGDGFTCSNIGVSCQPAEAVCLNRPKPDAK
jgi:hypothetical protein